MDDFLNLPETASAILIAKTVLDIKTASSEMRTCRLRLFFVLNQPRQWTVGCLRKGAVGFRRGGRLRFDSLPAKSIVIGFHIRTRLVDWREVQCSGLKIGKEEAPGGLALIEQGCITYDNDAVRLTLGAGHHFAAQPV